MAVLRCCSVLAADFALLIRSTDRPIVAAGADPALRDLSSRLSSLISAPPFTAFPPCSARGPLKLVPTPCRPPCPQVSGVGGRVRSLAVPQG